MEARYNMRSRGKTFALIALIIILSGCAALAIGSRDTWLSDVNTLPFSQKPACGKIKGTPFRVQAAIWDGHELVLSQGAPGAKGRRYFKISLHEHVRSVKELKAAADAASKSMPKSVEEILQGPLITKTVDARTKSLLEGKTFVIKPGDAAGSPGAGPVTSIDVKTYKSGSATLGGKCAMRLKFSKFDENGRIPGFIILREADKSYVEGHFYAVVSKNRIWS